MSRIVRLTESDLTRIVRKVLSEGSTVKAKLYGGILNISKNGLSYSTNLFDPKANIDTAVMAITDTLYLALNDVISISVQIGPTPGTITSEHGSSNQNGRTYLNIYRISD